MQLPPMTDQLLSDLGLADVSDVDKEQIVGRIQEMVDMEVLTILMSSVTKEQLQYIEDKLATLDQPEDEKVVAMANMLQEFTPNHESVIAQIIEDVFDRIRTDTKAIGGYLESIHYQPPQIDTNPQVASQQQ